MAKKIYTVCYGEKEVWASRKEAKEKFLEAFYCSEGSEQSRYATILSKLEEGLFYCDDGDEPDNGNNKLAEVFLDEEELKYLYNCLEATHDLTGDLQDMAEIEQSRRNAELYSVLHEKMLKKIMEE